MSSLDTKALIASAILGTVIVLAVTSLIGSQFGSPVLPFMAMFAGFILTGIIAGWLSKGETILEPGLASAVVAAISYAVVGSWDLNCFKLLPSQAFHTNMILVVLNGIILTFVGAWAGEKFQGTLEKSDGSQNAGIQWSWVLCGTVFGIAVSLLLATIIIIIFGAYVEYLTIALVIGIFFTGFTVGFRSPGVTMKEAAFAGFFALVAAFDVFKITLDQDSTLLTPGLLIAGFILSLIVAFGGGFAGEKFQAQ